MMSNHSSSVDGMGTGLHRSGGEIVLLHGLCLATGIKLCTEYISRHVRQMTNCGLDVRRSHFQKKKCPSHYFQSSRGASVSNPVSTRGVGRAIAQAVSRRHPTAAARVRAHVRSCGICGQCGTGAGFLRVLRFPLPILIPPTAPHSSSIVRGWYNRSVSGRRTKWTQSHPTQKKTN
jgi:hypothetical protein